MTTGTFGDIPPDERQGLVGEFLSEGGSYLENLNHKLVEAERAAKAGEPVSGDVLHEMFRMAHNIKGMSSFIGLAEIGGLTHEMENILQKVRAKELAFTSDTVDALFKAFDFLEEQFKSLRETGMENGSAAAAIARLKKIVNGGKEVEEKKPEPVKDEDSLNQKYIGKFIEDAETDIDKFNELLLNFETDRANAEIINGLFRIMHTIKGSGGLVGAMRVSRVAHRMENILSYLRETKSEPTDEIISLLFSGIDVIKDIVAMYSRNGKADYDLEPICNVLDTAYGKLSNSAAAEAVAAPVEAAPVEQKTVITPEMLPGEVLKQAADAVASGMTIYQIFLEVEENVSMKSLKSLIVQERIKKLGLVLFCAPELDDTLVSKRTPFTCIAATKAEQSRLKSAVEVGGVSCAGLEAMNSALFTAPPPEAKPEPAAPQPAATEAKAPAANLPGGIPPAKEHENKGIEVSTLRIDSKKLDTLMNLSGELVIIKARFIQLLHMFTKEAALQRENAALCSKIKNETDSLIQGLKTILPAGQDENFKKMRSAAGEVDAATGQLISRQASGSLPAMAHLIDDATSALEKISDDIQNSVMQARMVPVEGAFSRFKRIVRDIAKSVGKEVDLILEGEETELDKKIVDNLNDPLTHLIRNALDHGLEETQERLRLGKPRAGRLRLRAAHHGNSIWIEVADDGRGMDPEKIAGVAVKKGVISPSDAERLSAREKLNLIFLPGFSTAEKVTGISGRGVGMDVVKTMAASSNGVVDIETEVGKGTSFILKIPLTLAIINALLVRYGDVVYAFPLDCVVEILRATKDDVYKVDGEDTIKLREHALGLVDLERVLAIRGVGPVDKVTRKIVVITDGARTLGVEVEELLGDEEIVIKSLSEHFSRVKGITGASILGDGRIALILDPVSIIARSR